MYGCKGTEVSVRVLSQPPPRARSRDITIHLDPSRSLDSSFKEWLSLSMSVSPPTGRHEQERFRLTRGERSFCGMKRAHGLRKLLRFEKGEQVVLLPALGQC